MESRIDAAPATLEQSSERREVIRQELEALNLNDQDMLRLRDEATNKMRRAMEDLVFKHNPDVTVLHKDVSFEQLRSQISSSAAVELEVLQKVTLPMEEYLLELAREAGRVLG